MGNQRYEDYWKKKKEQEQESTSSDNTQTKSRSKYDSYWAKKFSAELPSLLDDYTKSYNTIYSSYNSRFDKDKYDRSKYRADTKSVLSSYEAQRKNLDSKAKTILDSLSTYGDYLDADTVAEIKSYLEGSNKSLSGMYDAYKSDVDYYSQWENEDAYKRDYDNYTYSNKYKDYSYADLQNAIISVKARVPKATGDELDALNRELYWLDNHSTDRQFADTMTTEELKQYKADGEGKVKELEAKISKLKTEKSAHERGGQTGKSNTRYQTVVKELESAEKELEEIKGKNSSVLYYDDDGIAMTVDNLITIRENEGILNNINNDVNAKSAYEKALKANENVNAISKKISDLQIEIQQNDNNNIDNTYQISQLNTLTKQLNDNKAIIKEFESMGYDFDSLEHYKRWDEDRQNYAKTQAENEKYAKEHPFLATGKSIITAPATALEFVGNLADSAQYGYANIYDDKYTMQNETYQGTVSTMVGDEVYRATGSEVASWLASTAYSGATSAAQSGMTALACTVMFGGAGNVVASAIMGTEAAASSYRSAIMNGSTNGEALAFSVASGVAECFFEWASLEKLTDNILKARWDTSSLSAFLKSSLKNSGKVIGQGLVEASEEFATELSNKVADAIINGDTSAYETAVRKYKAQGYSDTDAKELAQKDFVNDIVSAMVGGFFGGLASGGVVNTVNQGLAGASTVSNVVNKNRFYNQQGQNIVESGNVSQLVEQAKTLSNGSKSLQKLANEIAGVNTEEGLTDKQSAKYSKNVGKLYKGVQEAQMDSATNAERNTFKAMVKAELEGNKDIKNVDKVAEVITKAKFEGKDNLSNKEQKTFNAVDGLKIIDNISNSEEFKADAKKTKDESIKKVMDTGSLTIDEKKAIAEFTGYEVSRDGKNYIEATDEEVSIKNIKSVDNDDVVVTLDSGDHISIGEMSVNQDIAVIASGLKSLNGIFGFDAQAANYIYDLWTGTENVKASDFMGGIRSAMALAKTNNVNGLETDTYTKDLPETLRKAMFDVARNIEESRTQAKQSAIDKAVESRRESKKGKARAEGTGTVKLDGIKESDLNSNQKAQKDFLATIFTTMGINVEFFASPVKNGKHVGESGSYNPNTNTIRIDIFAGNEGKGLMLYTASHELTHFIREWSPAKFKVFADFLMENYNKSNVPVKELVQAKINNARLNNRNLSYDAAYEEVVADACERFLADSNAKEMLVSLAQQDQSLAQKVLQWIKDFVNLIKNALDAIRGIEPDSKESAYVQEMTDALESLRDLWDEALFDAMESYQWVGERVNQNEIAGIDYDSLEAAKNENGEELFQIRAIQHDVPEYRALLEKYGTLNSTEIDNLFNTMEKAFSIIEDNLEILDYAWDENLNEDGTWDDSKDARAFKPVKPNSDKLYKYSLDFSTLCRKRLLQQVIVEELSMALDRAVTKAESIAIRDELIKLQEEGRQLEIACALCYVESARMKSPEQIQKFLNDAGQKVREFFATKSKDDVVVAEEKARKRLAKQYAKEIKEGKMPSPTDTVTTKSGKEKYISLSKLPSNVAWEIRDAKREAKAGYTPTAEEQKLIDIANALPTSTFTTAEGLKNLAKEHPVIFDAYTSFVRNATHSKGTEKDVWYRVGDADVIGDDLIAAMNRENGLRSQSWSDFQVIHLLDYVGAIIELSTKEAKMQSYTKVPDYVNLIGLTGMMINLSLIPTQEFNGKLDFDSVEGMAFKIALELRDKYPSTAGTISIGVADEQIKLLLESADIDYVIPYHQSGMKKAVRKVMHIPSWESYEAYQGEKKITSRKDAMANANKHGVKLLPTSDANYQKSPNFSEWFDLELAKKTAEYENIRPTDAKAQKKYGVMYGAYKAMQDAADNYIKLCAERGLQPKFSYGKGDFSTEQNYWKLLIDRKMINQKTGEIIEQKAVKPVFNEGEVLGILNNEIARYEGVKEDFDYATHYVVERFLNGDMNKHINDIAKNIGEAVNNVTTVAAVDTDIKAQDRDSKGRELTPEQTEFFKDSKIRDENGNLRVVYHGTPNGDFNTFRISDGAHSSLMAQYGAGYYFDSVRDSAARYANDINKSSGKRNPKVFEVYLNITNPLEIYDEYIGDGERKRAISKQQFADVINRGNYEWFFANGMPFELRNYLGKSKEEIQQMPREDVISHWVDMTYDRAYFESDILSSMVKAYRGNSILTAMKEVFGKDGVKVIDKYGEMYVAWDNNSIKSIDNLNPTEDEDIRYSERVTPEEDAEYMDAYFDGDEDLMQELVDRVANRLGYKYKAYHHTENGFTVFDLNKARSNMDIQGFFFSADKDAESEYGSVRYDTYLKMDNPYIVDSKEKQQAIPFDMSKNNAGVVAREWLQSQGYDGVIRKAEYFGAEADEYIVFESSQIKSSDAMTFADDEYGEGDVIPLSERFNEADEDIRYQLRGVNEQGIEVYETSDKTMSMTWTERVDAFVSMLNSEYENKIARFTRNGHTYYAKLDDNFTGKVLYGENHFSKNGKKAFIKAGADGDLFDLIQNASYDKSKTDTKDHKSKDRFTDYFDYFLKTVQIDDKVFDINVTVKKQLNTKDGYTYTLFLVENKKIKASPSINTQGVFTSEGNALLDNNLPQSSENVNNKYQDRPQQVTLDDLGIDYKKENEKLKADVERMKELVKLQKTLTHGTVFTRTSVEKQASMLMQKFGLHKGKSELANLLNEYYTFIAKGEDMAWQSVIDKAEDVAKWIDSQIVRKTEIDEYSKDILSHIRSLRIRLDDSQKAEVAHRYGSYEAFRKSNMGSFILTDKGVELDSVWQELSALYPDVFDYEVNSADMPLLLAELIADLRTTDSLFNEYNKAEELRWMAEEIYDSYWNVSTLHTLADKQQKEVNLLKSKHRQQMDDLRDRHNSQMDDTKAHYQDMLKRVRADKDAKMDAYKHKVQDQRKKNVENRTKTDLKNKIKRVVGELNSILNNGTKERNVKIDLQETVNKALEMTGYLTTKFSNEEVLMAEMMTDLTASEKKMVDEYRQLISLRDSYIGRIEMQQRQTDNTNYKLIDQLNDMTNKAIKEIKKLEKELSGVIERNRNKLNEDLVVNSIDALADAYLKTKDSQHDYIKDAYSDYVYDRIVALKESVKGTKVSDMSLVQLQQMYDVYKMVMYTIRAANQLFIGGKRADINKAVSGVLFELDKNYKAKALPYKAADKALDVVRDFSYKELKPVYFFERLGSKTLKEIFFDEARQGEDIFARDIDDAQKFIQNKRSKYGYNSWDTEMAYDISLSSGKKLELSLGEIMSIYAYSKRPQALKHMTNGGFVFNAKEYFKTNKLTGKKSVREQGGTPYRINEFDFVNIKKLLTDEQIKYVDEMQDYLSTVMGAKGNEVSRNLYGIDLFKEKYYFPLVSSKEFLFEANTPAGEVKLKNTGMAKATVPDASNPIVLQSFDEVWANHVGKMSTYHALVLPIENMNKVLNYAEYIGDDVDSVSVKGVIGNIFTESATDYIKTYIRDLNGGVTTQGAKNVFAKMFSNFKKTAVAASMSTVVQQPTAILRAMAMINPKHFIGIKPSSYDKIKQYAPIAIIKEMGGFDAGGGRTASGYLLQETYEGGKDKAKAFFKDGDYRDSILMKGAEKGDELGWGLIWSAVERETAEKTTYAKGSEEFLQACGERFTEVISYTQVYDSVFSRSEYMRSQGELVKMSTAFMGEPTTSFNMLFNAVLQAKRGNISKGQAIGIIGAVTASIIAAAAAKSLIYGLRDDDDDESYLYKYTESLKDNLIGDLNPLNMLPFIKDVISLMDGWDVERTDMALFKDIKDACDGLDSDTKSTYRKIEDLAGAIAALGGIPLKNVMRTFREGYNFFSNIFDDNTGYDGGTPASSEVNDLFDKGKDAKAKEAMKEILEAKTEKYVKEGYTKAEAEKKAKSSLKSSVTSYWKEKYLEAYDNKDNAEMTRIRKILQSTGLYENVVETCQDWVKNKKTPTETDDSWSKW